MAKLTVVDTCDYSGPTEKRMIRRNRAETAHNRMYGSPRAQVRVPLDIGLEDRCLSPAVIIRSAGGTTVRRCLNHSGK